MDIGYLLTKFLAFTTLAGNLAVLGLLLFFVVRRSIFDAAIAWLGARAVWVGCLISTSATFGSLIYSEVVGYPACVLCWIQRIFMYPQLFLFGLALYRKERSIIPYAFFLSLIGMAVALYQWIKDMLLLYSHTTIPCPAVSGLPSCDKIYVLEMGYITIPMIALNAFVLLMIVMWAGMRHNKGQ
jgi:disulfide bond formation protein DsbB